MTWESFTKWKSDRKARQRADEDAELKRKEEAYKQYKSGKAGMQFSGRELFDFNPEWADAGDADDAMDVYEREPSEHGDEETEADKKATDFNQKPMYEMGGGGDDEGGEAVNRGAGLSSSIQTAPDEELYEELEGLDIDEDD